MKNKSILSEIGAEVMDSRSSKLWVGFGKISAILIALATLLTIYKTLFPSNVDVELTISGKYNTFALPPDIKKDMEILQEMTSIYFLRDYFSKPFKDEKTELRIRISDIATRFSDSLGTAIGDNSQSGLVFRTSFGFPSYSSFVYLLIKNDGDKTASDIVLDLPISGVALITEQDENHRTVEFKKSLKLNDLRPKNKMQIAIWSDERSINRYQEPDFKLTHKDGVEGISFGYSVFGFKKWLAWSLDTYGILFLSSCIALVGWLIYFVVAAISKSQKPGSEKENDQTEKKTAT